MRFPDSQRAVGLAFLTAAATLFVQVLVHRAISAKLLNNYAFLVISLTMLGFASSGVALSRWLPRVLERRGDALATCAALFALSLIGASLIFYRADVGTWYPTSRSAFLTTSLRWMPLAFLYAVPFFFCGLILGTLLSAPELPVRRVYFFDLLGSAAGAVLVIPAISAVGVEWSLLAAAGLMAAAAPLLAAPRGRLPRSLVIAALLATAWAARSSAFFDMVYPAGSILAAAGKPGGPVVERILWDPVARIELSRVPPLDVGAIPYPSLVGDDPALVARFTKMITQNNYAFTLALDYDGTQESLRGIDRTIYAAAYEATSVASPRVAVIGVGGGFDVLNALHFGASEVIGVEINAATLRILTALDARFFERWTKDPRVRLVNAEGRHFLATADRPFDVIQLSGVDSYSGTPGAAHVFSESYLYTAEAFDLYLSRLTDGGILNVMRLEGRPPREMLRGLTTAVAALRRRGVERPSDHIVMVTATNGLFTAMLVKRTPFSEGEQRRVADWAAGSRLFSLSAAPAINAGKVNLYQAFLALADPLKERGAVAVYPFAIFPAEDDRPFFFKYSYWWHLFSSDPVVAQSIPVMELSVVLLLGLVALACVVCIQLPLRRLTARGQRPPQAWRYGVFFAGAGIGYLAIEVALLQKFGLFLGHPNYALSVVLASLLFATGLGSLFSEAVVRQLRAIRFASYLLSGLILAEYSVVFPRLLGLIGLPFRVRAGIVFGLVAPIGFALGLFVPTGLARLKSEAPATVPWAWGINGIFSVLAPVLGVAVSVSWGINALLLAAIPVYLAVGFALPETDGSPQRHEDHEEPPAEAGRG